MSRLLDTDIGDFKLNLLKILSSLVTKISNFCYRRFKIKLVLQIILYVILFQPPNFTETYDPHRRNSPDVS